VGNGLPVILGEQTQGNDEQPAQGNRGQGRDLALLLQFRHALFQPGLQAVGAFASLTRVELGIALAGLFLGLQFLGAVIPVDDLLGQPVLHRCLGLGDEFQLVRADLFEVLGDHVLDRVALGLLFQVTAYPGTLGAGKNCLNTGLVGGEGAVVEVGGVVDVPGVACRVQFDVEHAFGNDSALTGTCDASVLDGVFQVEEHTRLDAGIALIDQDRAPAQEIAVAFEREVDGSIEQGVSGADEGGERLPLRRNQRLLESDALVARQDRVARPTTRSRLRIGAGTCVTS